MTNPITFEPHIMSAIDSELLIAVEIFNSRFAEAIGYIDYLKSIDSRETRIKMESSPNLLEVNRDFIKICRANGYLIIYNLVESTMYEAVKGLYQHLERSGVDIDSLIDKLKMLIFRGIRNSTDKNLTEFRDNMDTDFRTSIFQICFHSDQVKKMFSGNLDAKKIRLFSEEHGIDLNLIEESNNGRELLSIKNTRNDLAHGAVSFTSKGNVSVEQLWKLCTEVGYYLRSVIISVDSFLKAQQYNKPITI